MAFRLFLSVSLLTASSLNLALAQDTTNQSTDDTVLSGPTAEEFMPMTRSERASRYLRGLSDPESLFRVAAAAGIRQMGRSPKEWDGNIGGYGRRVGDTFANHATRRSLQYAASAILHEDNRYFLSGQTGFMPRVKYAIASTFLARRDNGDRRFSFSRVGSAAAASFLSRAWQPPSLNSPSNAVGSFAVGLGTDAGFNLLREFWPDLRSHFRKKR